MFCFSCIATKMRALPQKGAIFTTYLSGPGLATINHFFLDMFSLDLPSVVFFPTCQVRVVRFYHSCSPPPQLAVLLLVLLVLLLLQFLLDHVCQKICQIECQMEFQKICQIKCHKIWQIECQKICQIELEDMPDRMP